VDKTDLPEEAIAEYSGEVKATTSHSLIKFSPIALTGMLIFHFGLFQARSWGLIIDEVHLPAVFRITAELQARRRLGLTATLIREDGRG